MLSCQRFDVVVLGSGLAGICAALRASELGATVALVCDRFAGGSSFSSATWGLGMVRERPGAENRAPESLFKALCDVGMGMNDLSLAETLLRRSDDAMELLHTAGAKIIEPERPEQREYAACFDHVPRRWNGFVGRASIAPLMHELKARGVQIFTHADPISLLRDESGAVRGLLCLPEADSRKPDETQPHNRFTLHNLSKPMKFVASSCILATGGIAGLYGHHLCADTCRGRGHALALDAGAKLLNMEFQQLMLGVEAPTGPDYVYNEKLYRWSAFLSPAGSSVFEGANASPAEEEAWLEAHSWHGPYTTRLPSRHVDETLAACALAGVPARVRYDERLLGPEAPEFVQTYLTWLRDVRHVDPSDAAQVRMYAHSSNGGIRIDARCRTNVPGLFACGECAGGVHGADRIGGLASMTACTFGLVAGEEAVHSASETGIMADAKLTPCSPLWVTPFEALEEIKPTLGSLLDDSCMVLRDEETLKQAQTLLRTRRRHIEHEGTTLTIEELATAAEPERGEACQATQGATMLMNLATTMRRRSELLVGDALVTACRERRETRGPHHRQDFELTDPAQDAPRAIGLEELS